MEHPKLEELIELIKCGFHLIKIKPLSKQPATPKGFYNATNDVEIIKKWYAEDAELNWASVPGPARQIILDFDTYKNPNCLAEFEKMMGMRFPKTAEARSARGGRHFFFSVPPGIKAPPSFNGGSIVGLDYRSDTGFVLVSPSKFKCDDGEVRSYEWVLPPWDLAPVEVPLNVLSAIEQNQVQALPKSLTEQAGEELLVKSGMGRFDFCQTYAGILRWHGLGESCITESLKAFASYHIEKADEHTSEQKMRKLAQDVCRDFQPGNGLLKKMEKRRSKWRNAKEVLMSNDQGDHSFVTRDRVSQKESAGWRVVRSVK